MGENVTLKVNNISKKFPGVKALNKFEFELARGEVHGLIGENGAGKSTFIKILNGLYQQDDGDIYIFNKKIDKLSPIISDRLGMKFMHQEIDVFPYISIIDNIFMNNYPKKLGFIVDWKKAYRDTKSLLNEFELKFDPRVKVEDLSMGQMQLLEIITAVSKEARIIIMDEPTASLSDHEKNKLFLVIKSLKEKNISFIFVTHVLEEVLFICDRITVIRDSNKIGTYLIKDVNKSFLIEKIVGKKVRDGETLLKKNDFEKSSKVDKEALRVKDISYRNILMGVNFKVNYGEIIGILGLLGCGKSELAKICFGLLQPKSGGIIVNGKKINKNNPLTAIKNKIGFVSEDKQKDGIFQFMNVRSNLTIAILKLVRNIFGVIILDRERKIAGKIVKNLDIKISSLEQEIRNLSGGNQQKVILGRWLAGNQKILLLNEPTKGIDVGARNEFYKILMSLKKQKKAVIILTSDHREAFAICEKILLLKNGKIDKTILQKDTSPKQLLSELTKD